MFDESKMTYSLDLKMWYGGSSSLLKLLLLLPMLSLMTNLGFGESCVFPEAIQTNVSGQSWKRDWIGEVKDQFTQFGFRLEINGGMMRIVPTDSRSPTITRTCARITQGDRYLVKEGDTEICIRFVFRSPEVFQMSTTTSTRAVTDVNLCSDEAALRMNKWLIVDRERLGSSRITCPLNGGYNIRVYDKLRQRGICDAWESETRMESECTTGDGLKFLFRTQNCVPEDMFMYATQATNCLASWNDDSYSFVLLRHDLFHYTWLMRYPANPAESFAAYLLKDLVSDSTDSVAETFNYLRLDTTRDRPRSAGDLCYDDYERCSILRAPCTNVPVKLALSCPLKCGVCDETSASECRLSPDWIGKWDVEGHAANRSGVVTINSTTMSRIHHRDQFYRCVRWQQQSHAPPPSSSVVDAVMFVTEYANGCRPRYTCARFDRASPTLLNVSLGRPATWPFVQSTNETLDCDASAFQPKTTDATTHARTFTLHARDAAQNAAVCHLPFRAANLRIAFRNGTTCVGRLSGLRGKKGIELNLSGCSTSGATTNLSFVCVEMSNFPPNDDDEDTVVILRTHVVDVLEIYCLVFPKGQAVEIGSAVHLVEGSERCRRAMTRGARLDELHLLVGTISSWTTRHSTAATATTDRTDAATEERSVAGSSEGVTGSPLVTPGVEEILPNRTPASTIAPTKSAITPTTVDVPPWTTENPIVTGFAVFLFAIIQAVVYLCSWL